MEDIRMLYQRLVLLDAMNTIAKRLNDVDAYWNNWEVLVPCDAQEEDLVTIASDTELMKKIGKEFYCLMQCYLDEGLVCYGFDHGPTKEVY